MYYEINVALNGKHLFATAERSLTTSWEAKKMFKLFQEKFPEEEGYFLTLSRWEKVGQTITNADEL